MAPFSGFASNASSSPQPPPAGQPEILMGGPGRDPMEDYFECITTCSLDDGGCITECVAVFRESN